MASTNDATINAFYLAYYGRPADPAGLAYWSQALATSNGDFSSIVNAFATSAEATAHLGGGTATDQISTIYQQLFGHAPDAAGLAYWSDSISSGNMTLAEAAIQITNGAQSSDSTVSTLRQEVAAQFTASVAASGVAYDGDAAVAAARVLISAVNANTSATDITSLITAGASLVQTAHDNPAIITAMANGGDLSALLSTTSGQSDPVALVQALASIGKAALTDSAGLTALLHGGGVAGLIASLPAGTSIKDVAAAVDTGGLAAGTTVATTPVDTTPVVTTPAPTATIAFVGIDGKDLPAGTTLVTNSLYYFVDVPGLVKGTQTTFQVSDSGKAGTWVTTSEDTTLSDGVHYIRYLIKGTDGVTKTSNALELIMDSTVASPSVGFATNTGTSDHDSVSSDGTIKISGLDANESWSYSFDGKTWIPGATTNGVGTIVDSGATGLQTLQVRTLETVNGASEFTSTEIKYTVEKSVSGTLLTSGSQAAEVTINDQGLAFNIKLANGHANDITTAYEISTSGADGTFSSWTPGQTLEDATYYFRANIEDPAGNKAVTNTVTVHLDNTPPATPTVALNHDNGIAGDGLTNDGNFTVSGLSQGGTWQYTLDGQVYTGGPIAADGTASGYVFVGGEQTLQVVAIDAAGNKSGTASLDVNVDSHNAVFGMKMDHFDYTSSGLSLAHADVVIRYTDAIQPGDVLSYNFDNTIGVVNTPIDSSMINTVDKTITFHDVDLSEGDAYLTIEGVTAAGSDAFFQQPIDSPVTGFFTAGVSSAGLTMYTETNAKFYLTGTDGKVVALATSVSDEQSGALAIGAQSSVVEGVLGSGKTADTQTQHVGQDPQFGSGAMGFGTSGSDTITGSHVWGFAGDDTIYAVTSTDYYGSTIYGGLGADQIHVESTNSEIMVDSYQESSVVADNQAAHGFDTVYMNAGGTTDYTASFVFAGVSFSDNFHKATASGYTGNETGSELLALLNSAVAGTFVAGQGAAIISVGDDIKFVAVDTDGNGTIDATDYVVKVVGVSDAAGSAFSYHGNQVILHSNLVP